MERLSVPVCRRAMPGNILGDQNVDRPGTFSILFYRGVTSRVADRSSRIVAVVCKFAHLDGLVPGGYDYSRLLIS
jgi:hypothetical protein